MTGPIEPIEAKSDKGMARPAIVLLVVAAAASAILALVYSVTRPAIEGHKAARIVGIQKRVLPGADEYVEKGLTEGSKTPGYYEAMRGGSQSGRIMRVISVGYAGPIDMFVGIVGGKVTGVEVLSMKETPGFGDKVVVPKFLNTLKGRSAADPVAVGKDIDAVSGATITSRAVTKGVRDALDKEKALGVSPVGEGASK